MTDLKYLLFYHKPSHNNFSSCYEEVSTTYTHNDLATVEY